MIPIFLHFHSEEYRTKWREVLDQYQEVLEFLNRRYEFTHQDIREFQKLVDEYAQRWEKLTGIDGQTNYKHSLKC